MPRNATSSFVRTFAGTRATARASRLSEPTSAAHRRELGGASQRFGLRHQLNPRC